VVKLGFKTRQTDAVDWPTLRAVWELGDALDVFDSAWLVDHFVDPFGGGCHESWTTAAALASSTRRLQFGHLVLGNTYRHPALLGKMAATLDHIASGRFVVGLGAGWYEEEHAMFGFKLPSISDRMAMLESTVQILKGMWNAPTGYSASVGEYELVNARCDPPPQTPGGPRIWLGTQGLTRGLRIVAERADGWNMTGTLSEFVERRDALMRHCEAVGRDPETIEISAQLYRGQYPADVPPREIVREGLAFARAGANHIILPVRTPEGPPALSQLANEVAEPLRQRLG
jgi:alkanesulfonate monooxygenase SsuD/methylene tetrahydromethanopterin reductase-like flavin-dependent oxidoreductase (luciferase family)